MTKVKVRLVRSCRFSAGGEFYKLGDEFEIEESYAEQYSDMLEVVEEKRAIRGKTGTVILDEYSVYAEVEEKPKPARRRKSKTSAS